MVNELFNGLSTLVGGILVCRGGTKALAANLDIFRWDPNLPFIVEKMVPS